MLVCDPLVPPRGGTMSGGVCTQTTWKQLGDSVMDNRPFEGTLCL